MGILRVDTIQDNSGNPYPIPEGGGSNRVFYENDNVVDEDYTITSGKNAFSAGPIQIATGTVVTIPEGSSWQIGNNDNSSSTYSGADAWASVSGAGVISDGLNIASVIRTALGTYQVTFNTPMPNANYSVSTGGVTSLVRVLNKTANGFDVETYADAANKSDVEFYFAVFSRNATPPKGGTGTDAWAKVNGAGAFHASYNFSSVVRNSVGRYTLTFVNPMPTVDYAVTTGSDDSHTQIFTNNKTTTGFDVETATPNAGATGDANFSVAVNATNATLPASLTQDMIVMKTGDTMTGDLTAPNITVTDTITSPQVPAVLCNFGVTAANVITINSSFNVDSVVYYGNIGQYQINYTTPISGTGVASLTGTVGVINGGASYCNVLGGGSNSAVIATLSMQPNGSLAAEASNFYNFVVWGV